VFSTIEKLTYATGIGEFVYSSVLLIGLDDKDILIKING
jgi:hypothetical protein